MIFLIVPFCILFSVLGGQINKLFRPIGITLTILFVYAIWHNHSLWCVFPVLLYGVIYTLGYGDNSKLMKWLKSEQLVRIVLGLLISIPIVICSVLTTNWLVIFSVPFIVAVECIRMGSWGKIGKFDVLPVDILRGIALGLGISFALL